MSRGSSYKPYDFEFDQKAYRDDHVQKAKLQDWARKLHKRVRRPKQSISNAAEPLTFALLQTQEDLDGFLDYTGPKLLLYFDPGCPFCQQALQHFQKYGKNSKTLLAAVQVDEDNSPLQQLNSISPDTHPGEFEEFEEVIDTSGVPKFFYFDHINGEYHAWIGMGKDSENRLNKLYRGEEPTSTKDDIPELGDSYDFMDD